MPENEGNYRRVDEGRLLINLESNNDSYFSPISYRIEDLVKIWRVVSEGTESYLKEREGFIKVGPNIGTLGESPLIGFSEGILSVKIEIGKSYDLKVPPDNEKLELALKDVLETEEVKVSGKTIYREGERIATFTDGFLYEATNSRVNDEAEFAKSLKEAVETYRVVATETLRANEKPIYEEIVIIRPSFDLEKKFRRTSGEGLKTEMPVGVVVRPESIDVSFEDVGGQPEAVVKCQGFARMLRFPEAYDLWASNPPRGILMYGPPGCGKTLMAKALAKEADAVFFFVKGSDVTGEGFYGQAEKDTAQIFLQAKNISEKQGKHCIVFIDEIDLLLPTKGIGGGQRHEATGRVISEFTQGMDGLLKNPKLTVVASTNDPKDVDPRILSRMEEQISVPLPSQEGIKQILEIHLERRTQNAGRKLFAEDLDIAKISQQAEQLKMSGRDVADTISILLRRQGDLQLKKILGYFERNGLPSGKSIIEAVAEISQKIKKGQVEGIEHLVLPSIDTETFIEVLQNSKKLNEKEEKPPMGFLH